MSFQPIDRMRERLERDRNESDAGYWASLLYYGEFLTKLVTAGLVAGIGDDPDRLRYSQAHRLVRASGIGDWPAVIDEVLTGPPAQFLLPGVQGAAEATRTKMGNGTWQYEAVHGLARVLQHLEPSLESPPAKPALRSFFGYFARLRNKTRGHGAHQTGVLGNECAALRDSLELVAAHHPIFNLPWAHLRQSLSGKYWVSHLGPNHGKRFEQMKRDRSEALPEGVYIELDRPVRVDLLASDPNLMDFYCPNGDFNPRNHELLSYITGATHSGDSTRFLASPKDLPKAETEGLGVLEIRGNCFTNLPKPPSGYVSRPMLQEQLEQVLLDERRAVVTLHGPGGIGKTSLALEVLDRLTNHQRFEVIVWFSARDIELLPEGPKPVRPRVLAEKDVAKQYVSLLGPSTSEAKVEAVQRMAHELGKAVAGRTLFVFDNFETVTSPEELFLWLDQRIRAPNKILITTRLRSFNGDFQIAVSGMGEPESRRLIESTASAWGVATLLTDDYIASLVREADGHPYVIKVLLGEVAKANKLVKLERIIGDREHILAALFERTYERLSPAAKRLFLTIGRWRSLVPLLGLRAVVLRAQNERVDVEAALAELEKSSLIEIHDSTADGQEFASAPLVAAIFAQKKLRADSMKAAIEADVALLQDFGASQATDLKHGLRPRVAQLFKSVLQRAAKDSGRLGDDLPVLEFVARSYPEAWLLLADLFEELGEQEGPVRAQGYVRRYLEEQGTTTASRQAAWERMAGLSHRVGDKKGELNAWVEHAEASDEIEGISLSANNINSILYHRGVTLDRDEKQLLVHRVLTAFERFESAANGTTISRMAWLCCNVGDDTRARHLTRTGIARDPANEHLARLGHRLGLTP